MSVVLIIDDSAFTRKTIRKVVEASGHEALREKPSTGAQE